MKQWQHMGNKKQQRHPGRSNRDFISSSNRPRHNQVTQNLKLYWDLKMLFDILGQKVWKT